VIEMTGSLRSILDSIDKGHGILSELVKGAPDGQQPQLTLADIRKTFDNMNQLAAEMDVMLEKVNRGQGLAGAMFSEQTNGKELLDKVQSAATSMNQTAVKLNQLVDRFNQGNGAVQRLLSDQQYANQLLNNLQVSLADMKDILRKIDDGQGSVGLAVNDPSLYHDAKTFLGGGGGSMGWGMKMLNGLYGVTHPFHGGDATQPLTAPVPAAVEAPAQASQPPATTSLTR
jgi:phospholipid/cholesterol/gamma-HCH transport system substrate-binding protein